MAETSKSDIKSNRGRKPLLTFTRLCLSPGCGKLPVVAGRCSHCYYRQYRRKKKEKDPNCKTPGCPLTPCSRGYCYRCCQHNKPERKKKPQKVDTIGKMAERVVQNAS